MLFLTLFFKKTFILFIFIFIFKVFSLYLYIIIVMFVQIRSEYSPNTRKLRIRNTTLIPIRKSQNSLLL